MCMSAYLYICTERHTHHTCIFSSRNEGIYINLFSIHTSEMKSKLSLHGDMRFPSDLSQEKYW